MSKTIDGGELSTFVISPGNGTHQAFAYVTVTAAGGNRRGWLQPHDGTIELHPPQRAFDLGSQVGQVRMALAMVTSCIPAAAHNTLETGTAEFSDTVLKAAAKTLAEQRGGDWATTVWNGEAIQLKTVEVASAIRTAYFDSRRADASPSPAGIGR